jgi:ABC-type multidrug transport system ATPase subunit
VTCLRILTKNLLSSDFAESCVQFEDVSYKVELKPVVQSWRTHLQSVAQVRHSPKEKCILNGITASVAPGEMLALMGASGSGKTTLLNILGGRLNIHHKNMTGSVTYNGRPYSSALKRR